MNYSAALAASFNKRKQSEKLLAALSIFPCCGRYVYNLPQIRM